MTRPSVSWRFTGTAKAIGLPPFRCTGLSDGICGRPDWESGRPTPQYSRRKEATVARLFGTDGVRGVANVDVTPEMFLRLGRSLAGQLRDATAKATILVGRDPRPSSELLEAAFVAGVCSGGVDVLSASVMPTAGIAHLTTVYEAAAGAVITASHNPLTDNGLKLFDRDGYKYTDEAEIAIEALVDVAEQGAPRPRGTSVGRVRAAPNAAEAYLEHLVSGVPFLEGIEVTVDCANGASAALAPEAYRRAGARVREIASDLTGNSINCGVGATNPQFLTAAMRDRQQGIGLAHDGDADRLTAVDETGRVADGADFLAVIAIDGKNRGTLPHDTIVTTPVANSGLARSLAGHGIKVVESAIGDRAVLHTMLRHGYRLGGEQYGHIIMLDRATTGDGILTALQLMALMVRRGSTLHELTTVWTRAPQASVNVPVSDRRILEQHPELNALVAEERARLGASGRLIVRLSTIEPVVRVTCEAATTDEAQGVSDRIVEAINRAEAHAGEEHSVGIGS
jgi:phosphoglucosamine mutase